MIVFMTISELLASKSPVGSSRKYIVGLFESALDLATLCCSPSDNWQVKFVNSFFKSYFREKLLCSSILLQTSQHVSLCNAFANYKHRTQMPNSTTMKLNQMMLTLLIPHRLIVQISKNAVKISQLLIMQKLNM